MEQTHYFHIFFKYVAFQMHQNKKDSKDQESVQLSTTPVPEYQMGK